MTEITGSNRSGYVPDWAKGNYNPKWWGQSKMFNDLLFHERPELKFSPAFAAVLAMYYRNGRQSMINSISWPPTGYDEEHGWYAMTGISLGKEEDWAPYPSAEEAHTAYAVFEQLFMLTCWDSPLALCAPSALQVAAFHGYDPENELAWRQNSWSPDEMITPYDRTSFALACVAKGLRFQQLRDHYGWINDGNNVLRRRNSNDPPRGLTDPGLKLWTF